MEPIRYHVAIDDAHAHLYAVSSTFSGPFTGGALDVCFATWTPGSYLQREFARHAQDVRAEDDGGRALGIEKIDKHTWRVSAGGAARVTVRMRVYANDLTVRTSHLDGTHAYFNGANLFVYRTETLDAPCVLTLDVPAGWRVATALEAGSEKGTWKADDWDHLVDCPVEIGTHESISFTVEGVPHEVAIWGGGNHDPAALKADLEKIVKAQSALMGGLPFRKYLFIVHLTDRGRGGLEHRDSTTLLYPRFGFRPRKEYEEFLRLAAHEYFHVWNVKRLKPKAFDPYDYQRENYTKLLWAMEGFTEYYEILSCARAGVVSKERLLAIFAEEITALLRTPGRKTQSLAESSFDAWIKYYRGDENTVNAGVSYYRKGALVALALDMEIRARTRNAKSLDDVVRLLYARHGAKGKGAPEDAYSKALAEVSGASMDDLLARYVNGTDEIDFAAHLKHGGMKYLVRAAEGPDDKGGTAGKRKRKEKEEEKEREAREDERRVWLGFDTRLDKGRAIVSQVLAGSPAAKGGLYVNDELVAVDGWRADDKAWRARANEKTPGSELVVTVLRRDKLTEVRLTAAAPPQDTAWIEADPEAAPDAKAVLASWSGGAAT